MSAMGRKQTKRISNAGRDVRRDGLGHPATASLAVRSLLEALRSGLAVPNQAKGNDMTRFLLLMGAAALSFAAQASAKPDKAHGSHSKGAAADNHGKSSDGLVYNGGRLFALDARGSCPQGLAKKGNGCLPPGQAKKLYNVGQRYNRNFGNLWTYDQIPLNLRNQYTFDPYDRYYYNQGYLYQVDPKTMLIQQVISALLR